MADTAIVSTQNYDSIIDGQQKRIHELEADLARYSDKIRMLKTRATEQHHSAMVAAAAATDYARIHTAHVHAMLAMSAASSPVTLAPSSTAATPVVVPPRSPTPIHCPPGRSPTPRTPNTRPTSATATTAISATQTPDVDDERAGKTRYWTEMEHNQFLCAVKLFGPKNYVAISQFVGTRTPKQVRTHAQKYQMKLQREAKKRRAQAAAVVAVTAPGAAAAAAAAAAAMACGGGADRPFPLHGFAGLPGMPFMPMPIPQTMPQPPATPFTDDEFHTPTSESPVQAADAAVATTALRAKSECDAAQSISTCPTVDEGEASTDEGMLEGDEDEDVRDSAYSAVSNDSDSVMQVGCSVADEESGALVDGLLHSNETQSSGSGNVISGVGVESGSAVGLKRNSSLGNLADYDDFMRRITNAVQNSRGGSDHVFDESTNDLDMDILDSSF